VLPALLPLTDRLERVFAVRAHATGTNSRRVSNSSLGVILNTRLALFEVSVKSGLPGAITLEPPPQIQIGREAAGQGNLVGHRGHFSNLLLAPGPELRTVFEQLADGTSGRGANGNL